MDGYWDKPEQTADALREAWLHTGDVAVLGEDGLITIVDRLKDLIITGGFNVYSREVETVLATHPAVASCAVYGVPDERWGEIVVAAVVLRDGVRRIARRTDGARTRRQGCRVGAETSPAPLEPSTDVHRQVRQARLERSREQRVMTSPE